MQTTQATFASIVNSFAADAPTPFGYKPIIVWAINDRVDPRIASEQFDGFKRCGYGGVMIMPWGAMPYGFMDGDWLDAVEHAVNHAATIGLDVWLWDDWLFGSGAACGQVTTDPAFRAKTLHKAINLIVEPGEEASVIVPPRALAVATFTVDKFGNPASAFEPRDATPGATIRLQPDRRTRLTAICNQPISGMVHTPRSHGFFLDTAYDEEACHICTTDDPDVWSVDMLNPRATARYLSLIHERYHQRLAPHFGKTIKGFFYDEPKTPTLMPWTEDFAERFQARKGYDIVEHLVESMSDHVRDGGNHNPWSKSPRARQVAADYRDVWTSLVAESFYKPIHDWCRAHGVICTGHQICDNSLAEMFCGGGVVFKNLRFSDMPGVDTISGGVKPGVFTDFARYASSVASLQGLGRAMSESFAVYGHGVTLDEMRYVCEHQITRGINTFFAKLTNYNRPRSVHFHPPDLSEDHPLIAAYGPVFARRIENVTRLMSAGAPSRAVGLYMPLGNYYHDDRSFTAAVDALARKLTYNQVDYDYICDVDVAAMTCDDRGIISAAGRRYDALLIAPGSTINRQTTEHLDRLVARQIEGDALDAFIAAFHERDPRLAVASRDVAIAVRRRINDDGAEACFMLSEAADKATLNLQLTAAAHVWEIDLDTWDVTRIGQGAADTALALDFAPGQSRLIEVEPTTAPDVAAAAPAAPTRGTDLTHWTLTLPDRTTRDVTPPFPEWSSFGFGGYTGAMTYTATFELDTAAPCKLSLGDVRHAATVIVDGQQAAAAVFAPFVADLGTLAAGRHTIELRVINTPANAVFGDPAATAKLREAGALKGTYAPIYEPLDRCKLRSGLFGPVRLIY